MNIRDGSVEKNTRVIKGWSRAATVMLALERKLVISDMGITLNQIQSRLFGASGVPKDQRPASAAGI